jgi:hypothetical protein
MMDKMLAGFTKRAHAVAKTLMSGKDNECRPAPCPFVWVRHFTVDVSHYTA